MGSKWEFTQEVKKYFNIKQYISTITNIILNKLNKKMITNTKT